MLIGPIDSRMLVGNSAQVNQGKKFSDTPVDFETMLRNSRIQMLENLINPNRSFSCESAQINPLASHQWVLDWMLKTRITSPSSNNHSFSHVATDIKSEEKLQGIDPPVEESFISIPKLTTQIARKHGIPPTLFHKLIETESRFDPSAKSSRGAMGLGQLMPKTARELGLNFDLEGGRGSVWDPTSNLNASAKYLGKLFRMYRNRGITEMESWKFAAGAYNAGMGNIQKAIDRTHESLPLRWEHVATHLPDVTGKASRETLHYVSRITA